jgi:hypothetical protein
MVAASTSVKLCEVDQEVGSAGPMLREQDASLPHSLAGGSA